ncbi:hypothetical protein ABFS83_04G139000 [Erythranthe nasuta]
MQDIHAFGGGAAGGGGGGESFFGGGDRRLRPHSHPNNQVLKCPRCESINTKFCYYNNYNLSQPRHFCKSCRRYWTKGGVLRNVPVGGGCRKAKRSKQKSSAAASPVDAPPGDRSPNAQSSSSESSSLTAAATTTAATPTSTAKAAAEEGSPPSNKTKKPTAADNYPDSMFFNGNPNFDHQSAPEGQIFATDVGSFTSLMESSSTEMMGFGMADIATPSYERVHQENQTPAPNNSGLEMTGVGMNNDGLAATLDWGGGGDQGMFNLTAAVDPAYWSQSHWNDQSLNYLL